MILIISKYVLLRGLFFKYLHLALRNLSYKIFGIFKNLYKKIISSEVEVFYKKPHLFNKKQKIKFKVRKFVSFKIF